jgi:hypothetical protein
MASPEQADIVQYIGNFSHSFMVGNSVCYVEISLKNEQGNIHVDVLPFVRTNPSPSC